MDNQHKQKQKTEYEIWRNVIPKNNNLKESHKLIKTTKSDYITINHYVQSQRDLLGAGQFGEVYKVQNQKDEKQYACKIFKRNTFDNKFYLNNEEVRIGDFITKELAASKLLKNENLTIAYEIIDDEESDCIYLIMELCEGEFCKFDNDLRKQNNEYFIYKNTQLDLTNLVFPKQQIDENKIKKTQNQLINGLYYLHNLNLSHCDIKPQNIMIKDNNAKIADFGSLAWTDPTHLISTLDNGFGTPQFNSPESIHKHDKSSIDKFKCDIWALGMTAFIFAFGQLPFKIKMYNGSQVPLSLNLQWKIVNENYQQSEELKDFIEQILNPIPSYRPSIFELIDHDQLKESNQSHLCSNSFQSHQDNQFNINISNSFDLSLYFQQLQGINRSSMVLDSSSDTDMNQRLNKRINYSTKSKTCQVDSESFYEEDPTNTSNQLFNSGQYKNESHSFQREEIQNLVIETMKSQNDNDHISNEQFNQYNLIKDLSQQESQMQNEHVKEDFEINNNDNTNDDTNEINILESKQNCKIPRSVSTQVFNSFNIENEIILKDQFDLKYIIFKSIKHKQRSHFLLKEDFKELRRKSDSILFDVQEIKNDLIIKDQIIFECVKQIHRIGKE